MGTYDTRGGTPASPPDDTRGPSKLVESILGLLEDAGCPENINDAIVNMIEEWELAQSTEWEKELTPEYIRELTSGKR